MSDKKGGLSAFLAKQKKGKKKGGEATAEAGPTATEEAKTKDA